ncbi:hypothetical protein AAFF_G00019690 [Aldrovandia affinis]|uniref:Uncharacterized protein n=1 Tax=Aldrovandia affinis TaxID=143900 RepID=A0AAD7S5J3_9TELE|nr:hypothetical protein AAFF_G00019690 [Aldrovandia affinis]
MFVSSGKSVLNFRRPEHQLAWWTQDFSPLALAIKPKTAYCRRPWELSNQQGGAPPGHPESRLALPVTCQAGRQRQSALISSQPTGQLSRRAIHSILLPFISSAALTPWGQGYD